MAKPDGAAAHGRDAGSPALARTPRHDNVGLTGGDGHGGVADGGTAGTPAVPDLGEVRHVTRPDGFGQRDLVGGLQSVRGQPINLLGVDAGIDEGRDHRFGRQLGLGAVDPLGEFRLPDADDCRCILQRTPCSDHPGDAIPPHGEGVNPKRRPPARTGAT